MLCKARRQVRGMDAVPKAPKVLVAGALRPRELSRYAIWKTLLLSADAQLTGWMDKRLRL